MDIDAQWTILILITRFLEFLGIIMTFFLMFKGYKVRYVFIVAGIVALSITASLIGIFFREYLHIIAIADVLITGLLLFGVLVYVLKNPEKAKDFTPPEDARCAFCNVYITNDEELCTMKVGPYTLFFENFDHMLKMMEEADFFLENKKLPKGEVKEIFVKTKDTKRWKKISDVHVVKEGGTYVAYENKPTNSQEVNLKEILDSFKNKVGGD